MQSLTTALIVLGTSFQGYAAAIIYNVKVTTTALKSVRGSLDFQLNPGPLISQVASLQILSFSGDGTPIGTSVSTGDVFGSGIPQTLSFDNGGGLNDYFQPYMFGSTLSFDLNFYGPALEMPDGTATSGSSFAFSIFSDEAGTTPALTTNLNDGFAFLITVNLDGTTTVTNYSPSVTISPKVISPEPSAFALSAVALASLSVLSLLKRPVRRSLVLKSRA